MFVQEDKRPIRSVPPDQRPRERLQTSGAAVLTDLELLQVMIGSGNRNRDVRRLASDVLQILEKANYRMDVSRLREVKGLGAAKAGQLAAALEFARRILSPSAGRIASPADVLPHVRHYAGRKQEYFLTLSLNGAHEVLNTRVVSIGLVNRTLIHPREIFADPITDRAAAVIAAHNHPSGSTDPSHEDQEVTSRLRKAGEILGIPLLDHIIFTETGFYSFLESGRW
ncbi:MAG: DNA repair protein RadC [Spirochaetales bacterium]|nr:DNA repair protein RadC [Spirochaetales bacterium]MCF7938701.1 DNA repair protein RadC [Spirochaetales bacterium]